MPPVLNLTRPEGAEPQDFHLSRRGVAGLFFAGYALATGPVHAQAITTPTDGLFTQSLKIKTLRSEGKYEIPLYIAMPEKAKNRPVIIVVSEVFGVHDYIRDVCRRLAHKGYVAVAPDFFARKGNAAAVTDFEKIKDLVEPATNRQVMDDMTATLNWLKTDPDLGQKRAMFGKKNFADMSRVGVTGFCWGGAVTWMAAASIPDVKAGVAWYGRLQRPPVDQFLGKEDRKWPLDVVPALNKPVLGLYASDDAGIPQADVDKMNAALKAANKPSNIIVYPSTKHAFHADYRPSYAEGPAKQGWEELLKWFDKYL
ncbi:dienelactone hydrolase family protein [Asticcacaulis sp. SL142]|uniref:dienelactone hydrolase family protein n=1 Tax=Asticcacaulis sp. SL142 TaxID=2995155 RepID=UPI00226CC53C|nr:dienelactone hydrolase family protein [Asticcacaulis sp. SL142]WAC47131.1 dienelactone hydrolase family protein [Asticcacaulis sp. SL142]